MEDLIRSFVSMIISARHLHARLHARAPHTRARAREIWAGRVVDGPRNDRSGSPESCGCLARATRNISPRSFARTKSERAPLRWGVIYVAEGGNCPRILCPACPRGRYIPPGCIHGKQCSQSRTPKRFLVSAVILAINRSPIPPPASPLR